MAIFNCMDIKNLSPDLYNQYMDLFISGFEKIKHRGPDMSKIYTDKNHIYGFHRLSIIDTSESGMQPFIDNETGITVMCNGEIYNYKELIKEYNLSMPLVKLSNGENEISKSDCAILIDLYKKVGFEKMYNLLNGDFAIILTDGEYVYLARDRIGVRPLFYGKTYNGHLAVASEAKALENLCLYVNQFPGNTCIAKQSDLLIYTTLSDIKFIQNNRFEDSDEYICNILNKYITNSVKQRLITDRPIGVLLSGGLDSSLITSILCRYLGSENIRTYSIGMKGSPDLKNAKLVSDFLKTNHTEIIMSPNDALNAIPRVIEAIESYDITTIRASVPMFLLAEYIRDNTEDRVIFSGEGSDEIFCGYLYFHNAPSIEDLNSESCRLINNLRYYDVLRADRCISSASLELRVPFLDPNLIDLCCKLHPKFKQPKNGIEKYYLRMAFNSRDSLESKPYLPNEVLWRRKDGLSDGCSSDNKTWYQYIQEYVENLDIDYSSTISGSLVTTKESLYYRYIYDKFYKKYCPDIEFWMPKWSGNIKDPSGRLVNIKKDN